MAKKGVYNVVYKASEICRHTDLAIAKARLLHVRLVSMAMTGFFYTFKRPRTSPMMGMLKYDPIGPSNTLSRSAISSRRNSLTLYSPVRKKVLFLETKKRSK